MIDLKLAEARAVVKEMEGKLDNIMQNPNCFDVYHHLLGFTGLIPQEL